jgi:hypothetical protein
MIISINSDIATKLDCINMNVKSDELYDVYAMRFLHGEISYMIFDIYDIRTWIENKFIKLVSQVVPPSWYFGTRIVHYNTECAFFGYKELIINKKHYEDLFEGKQEAVAILLREKKMRTELIEKFDFVRLLTDLPEQKIPAGSFGMVSKKPDYENFTYTVTFYKHDGGEYAPIEVPRVYLALDTKA